jgi:putative ABC transport system permease protein
MNWTAFVQDSLTRHGAAPDEAVVEELAQHATASFEAARADGLADDEAIAHVQALVEGWCVEAARLHRRPRRPPVVEPPPAAGRGWVGAGQDLRYGVRLLRRQPGFALLATLLIALGVGAAATLGNVAYAVLMKPLSWPNADRLVLLSEVREGQKRTFPGILTNATYLAWRDAPATLDGIAGYSTRTATLTVGEGPERIRVTAATASLFPVLQARAAEGRLFTAANESAGGDHVIVLSYGLWQRRFAGRPDAVGQTLELDGDRYRVVATMPPDFVFPNATVQAWTPLVIPAVLSEDPAARSVSLFRSIGRLHSTVTPAQASGEGTARGRAAPGLGLVGTAMFGTQGPPRVTAAPYLESLTADVRPGLIMLLAAVALLLAAAVANVAGMQLARATSRRREVAIRSALGAGPARIARQLLTENLVIGLAGGGVGWLLSIGLQRALPQLLPADFPRADDIPSDWRVLVLAIGSGVAASLVCGSLPALLARRINLVGTLVEDSLAPVGGRLRSSLGRMRAVIMTGQVAIAALLLVGASLMGQSFFALLRVDRGYDPHNLLTATLPMPDRQFSGPQRAAALDAIVGRLSHLPGVTSAAGASIMPLVQYDQPMAFQMPSGHGRNELVPVQADLRSVSPDYFKTLGIPVVEGRTFSEADSRTSQPVVVVNRAFVKTYLTGSAVGVRLPLTISPDNRGAHEVIGVVDDVHQQSAADPPRPEIFNLYRQVEAGMRMPAPVIMARTAGNPADLAGPLRAIVREENPTLGVDSVMTMDERLLTSLARPRLYAVLLGAFGGFALLVAGAGLFGVLSYSVSQRSREIGVRAALGAQPADIIRLVVRQGLVMTMAGLVAGLAAAAALVKLIGTMLYGVTTRDPVSYAFVALALMLAAGVACVVPARRAARIDPLKAMRS